MKNAWLSLKQNKGRTILLFVFIFIIANLMITGLSIKSAIEKSMDQVRTSLGSDVTLSYKMLNMMEDRGKGESMENVMKSITVSMADQLKDLKYVESYNYTLDVGVSSDDIDPISVSDDTQSNNHQPANDNRLPMMEQNDFTVVGNTTMKHLENFTNENYVLKSGRLLNEEDSKTHHCVIETQLASDNDLEVGDKFTVYSSQDDEDIEVTLTIVGIYEVETSKEMGGMMSNRQNPYNQIYTDVQIAQTLNNNDNTIASATYYLDDPDHIEAFQTLAKEKTDIDFETYTLNANDQIYQKSITSLENMNKFASIFLGVVFVAGSVILCFILVLTLRNRFYELGVFLSLGQSKWRLICQQLYEVVLIALVAFMLSLGSGQFISNTVSGMLVTTSNEGKDTQQSLDKKDQNPFEMAMTKPTYSELDVSLNQETMIQLGTMTLLICVISITVPSLAILRLSPREILTKKEG